MKKAKIAVVTVGHYIYFEQFEGLREELMQKSADFIKYIDTSIADVYDAGYIDCVQGAFDSIGKLKAQDADLLFIIMSTYVPSAVCAPFARYLDIPQILVGIQPLNHLDYSHTTTYMQLANDDVCAIPEAAGVYIRMGRNTPPCIIASSSQQAFVKKEVNEWVLAASAMAAWLCPVSLPRSRMRPPVRRLPKPRKPKCRPTSRSPANLWLIRASS